jgi:hypothetical protein
MPSTWRKRGTWAIGVSYTMKMSNIETAHKQSAVKILGVEKNMAGKAGMDT